MSSSVISADTCVERMLVAVPPSLSGIRVFALKERSLSTINRRETYSR